MITEDHSGRRFAESLPAGICERKPYWLEAVERSDMRFPASCDAYRCPTCGPRKAEQAAAIMTWSIREAARLGTRCRFVTLTNAPADWQRRRKKVRVMREWARRELGVEWEFGWATEVGKDVRTLPHVHGIEHGAEKIEQAALQERWGGIIDIRLVRTPAVGVYAVKDALRVAGYTVKGATGDQAALVAHLDLNGGRAAHWSRGFLHGLTKREALAQARAELADGEVLTWRLVPAWTL